MSESGSLVNVDLGEFGKAANTLVTKISNAIGAIYKPHAIVKEAEANAKARAIEAKSNIEVNELQSRAMNRFLLQEERKQRNYESIIEQTIQRLPPDSKPEFLDEDWLAYYFERCSTVSDKEMQFLWASLLSGEAEKSGSYSKRTIDFISTVSKEEAQKFTEMCQFVVQLHDSPYLMIEDINASNIFSTSLNYADFVHMESIGLIAMGGGYRATELPKEFNVTYHQEVIKISLPEQGAVHKSGYEVNIGNIVLTPLGHELRSLCETEANNVFFQSLLGDWTKSGVIVINA